MGKWEGALTVVGTGFAVEQPQEELRGLLGLLFHHLERGADLRLRISALLAAEHPRGRIDFLDPKQEGGEERGLAVGTRLGL